MLNNIALIATLHDPQGHIIRYLNQCFPYLTELYQVLVVIATPASARKTNEALMTSGVKIYIEGSQYIGVSRRRAIARGMENSKLHYFHYCDFDRLIHWTLNDPYELEHVVRNVIPQSVS